MEPFLSHHIVLLGNDFRKLSIGIQDNAYKWPKICK